MPYGTPGLAMTANGNFSAGLFEKTKPIFGLEKECKCLFERALWELL
jgi:hypothetical protein